MSQSILTKDTLIPVGAVIVVLSAAFSYGIMYQKVDTLQRDLAKFEDLPVQVAELKQSVEQLTKEVNRLVGSKVTAYAK